MTLILPDTSTRLLMVRADEHVLEAALTEGIDLPYGCLQGWCLTCAAEIVQGRLDQRDSRRYYAQDREEGFALLCTAKAQSNCILKTHAREAMRRARDKHNLPYPKGDWGSLSLRHET